MGIVTWIRNDIRGFTSLDWAATLVGLLTLFAILMKRFVWTGMSQNLVNIMFYISTGLMVINTLFGQPKKNGRG